mgnify:FL=1
MEELKIIKTFLLDTLFPISCISCGKDNVWFCDECLQKIELLSFQVCPKCEKIITENGNACRNCKSISSLDGLLVACRYKNSSPDNQNILAKLVHLYKYRFIEDLHMPLGKILIKAILQSQLPIPDIIIPIPLHPRRLRWRGFNQSDLLAGYIGNHLTANFTIPIENDWLRRKKFTQPQMKIKKYTERLANLQDAFFLDPNIIDNTKKSLHGKTILLVDDIATTGATLFECAKILKTSGVKKVFAIVLARQEM